MGSLQNAMMCKCLLLRVLRPISGLITTLDCVLLKDNNWAPITGSGLEINSRTCLCVLQGPRHNARCSLSVQRFIFLLIFCLETPKKDSGPNEPLSRNIPCEPVGNFVSSHSGMPRDPKKPHSTPDREGEADEQTVLIALLSYYQYIVFRAAHVRLGHIRTLRTVHFQQRHFMLHTYCTVCFSHVKISLRWLE
jgi:hypothetical protein